jgi:hypothetical protein
MWRTMPTQSDGKIKKGSFRPSTMRAEGREGLTFGEHPAEKTTLNSENLATALAEALLETERALKFAQEARAAGEAALKPAARDFGSNIITSGAIDTPPLSSAALGRTYDFLETIRLAHAGSRDGLVVPSITASLLASGAVGTVIAPTVFQGFGLGHHATTMAILKGVGLRGPAPDFELDHAGDGLHAGSPHADGPSVQREGEDVGGWVEAVIVEAADKVSEVIRLSDERIAAAFGVEQPIPRKPT